MNLSISHIAWPPDEEEAALAFVKELGVSEVEVAPVRAFGNALDASESEVRDKAGWYRDQGFRIGSFQALLFGTDGLELFTPGPPSERLKEVLIATGRVAGWAGAGPMVFGSPRNRLRGDLSTKEAHRRATAFFREVGDACASAGSCVVIEANPEAYGADFCTNLEEAVALVESVDSPGFGLHIDAGGMALGGDDFESLLRDSAHLVRHVHASQPNLISFATPDPIHARIAAILAESRYGGTLAIEMRAQPDGLAAVANAIEVARAVYFGAKP